MSAFIVLDVHKDWSFATVLDQTGRVVVQKHLENEHIPSFLEGFNVLKVGLEASTHVASLYRALVDRGFRVEVSYPKKTRYIAEARIKSDRVDSNAIAELVRLDALPKSYIPPSEIASLGRSWVVRRLSRELKPLAGDDDDVRLLMTIPGLGYYLALLVKAEVGDVSRFKSGDHLRSYAGLVPSTYNSEGVTRHGGITREGSWAMLKLP